MEIAQVEDYELENYITEAMLDIGVPAHLKGYHYLREAIMLSVKDMELVNYWVNTGAGEWNINNLIDYSGELKELIGHRNLKFGQMKN